MPDLVGGVTERAAPANTTLSVQVSVRRGSDGKYFSGSAWSATPTLLPATVTNGTFIVGAGSLPTNSPNGQFLQDDQYTLTATATDGAGHSATTAVTLRIDHTAPTITITTPAANATVRALTSISGRARGCAARHGRAGSGVVPGTPERWQVLERGCLRHRAQNPGRGAAARPEREL